MCASKNFEITLTFMKKKNKENLAELISFLLKLNPEGLKGKTLFMRESWAIQLLFPSLILKERFVLQILKSKYVNKRFEDFPLNKLEKKADAEQMLVDLREIHALVSELDGIEKKAESAFKKQSEAQTKIRFEDLIFDEEKMETTRKNWRKGVFQANNEDGETGKSVDKQNPLFLKEKLILCQERIKEKEKEIEKLEKEVKELDTQKKDLEYLYGDQYLEEVFGEKEIEELQKGNDELQNQILQLEDELKGFIGSHEEIGFEFEIGESNRPQFKKWASNWQTESRVSRV